MAFRRKPVKLQDCVEHGPESGAELFLVEGDSASSSVGKVCSERFQAVLPMQGKPLNAIKSSVARVQANELLGELTRALGAGTGDAFDVRALRFQRVLLLMDPDADGIHCGALMLMFFYRFMPALLDQERLLMVRAPLFRITSDRLAKPAFVSSQAHREHVVAQLEENAAEYEIQHYRGLGSLEESLMRTRCVDPATRSADIMKREDAESAIRVFAASSLHDDQ